MTERLSVCCGAPELLPNMCAACREWTSFETEEDDVECDDYAPIKPNIVSRKVRRVFLPPQPFAVRWTEGDEQDYHADWARTWADVGLAAERGATP